jgi:glycosyltransferase involved in cell wall biosynthesis
MEEKDPSPLIGCMQFMRNTSNTNQKIQPKDGPGALHRKFLLCKSRFWQPYSRLFFPGDDVGWVLSWEAFEVSRICEKIGIRVRKDYIKKLARRQVVFFASSGMLLRSKYPDKSRVTGAYFHGIPGTGYPDFDKKFQLLCEKHEEISRIQVTNDAFRKVLLQSGISPEKVKKIPIGINPVFFQPQEAHSKNLSREKYNIPRQAIVVGSFQKDGAGWGEGLEPKREKGPDVFLRMIEILKDSVPELFVLLSGPARGYVKQGLERLGVEYRHLFLEHYPDIAELYQCLDLYIVSSRDEGGPKAVLESMASGVPVVSTRVGQATELIEHGENGWLTDLEDAEALAYWSSIVIDDHELASIVAQKALATAAANSYDQQLDLWSGFFGDILLPTD